jgi:zinc protease
MTMHLPNAPQPAAPRPFYAPAVHESRLDNGMSVIVAPRRGIPLIGAQFTVTVGAVADSVDLCGVSEMTARMIGYGSQDFTSEQFSMAMDAIGAKFAGSANYDSMTFGVSALTHLFPQALAYAAQAMRNPALAEDDLERLRTRTLSELRLTLGSAGSMARLVSGRVVYGDHAYGAPLGGTIETNEAFRQDDARALAARRIRPQNATLVLVGDLTAEQGHAFAQAAFGDWLPETASAFEMVAPLDVASVRRGRKILVNMADSGRSAVIVGRPGLPRSHPRYLEATVVNALLSGYSGRLNREVRVKRGLSYGASSAISGRHLGGAWMASTLVDHAKVEETVQVILDVLDSLAQSPPTIADLNTRKAMLRGSFGRGLETVGGLAGAVGNRVVFGLPLSELSTYLERLDALTPEQVAEVAGELLKGTPHIVVVGEADQVTGRMKADDVEFFETEAVELRNASLKRA